jgi:RNA polymerase sigma factor (sigma-70 family)
MIVATARVHAEDAPLTHQQRRMVEGVVPLARAVVRHVLAAYPAASARWDELLSEAHMGFVEAARKYNPSYGRSWPSFAYGGGVMRCRAWLHSARWREPLSVDAPLTGVEDGDFDMHAVTPSPAPLPDELVLQHQALAALESLPPKEKEAVSRVFEDLTLAEVGESMGLSRERVRHYEARGLHLVRQRLGIPSVDPESLRHSNYAINAAVVRQALADGVPRTMRELAEATGYTVAYNRRGLLAASAVRVGTKSGAQRGKLAATWALPARAV